VRLQAKQAPRVPIADCTSDLLRHIEVGEPPHDRQLVVGTDDVCAKKHLLPVTLDEAQREIGISGQGIVPRNR
jgi:hypothetical protein